MMNSTPKAWEHQTRAAEFLRDKEGAMLAMEMGTGKDLDDRTPIATPEGWTSMGGLRAGQQVFDESGQPCTVTGVYPQGEKPVCDVVFDDGTRIRAGYEHLWVTLTHGDRARIHKGRNAPGNWASRLMPITTEEIRQSLVHQRGTLVESMHSIPVAMPLDLPDMQLPIDPYIWGCGWETDRLPNQRSPATRTTSRTMPPPPPRRERTGGPGTGRATRSPARWPEAGNPS